MQDQELYRQILGIEAPWHVERVELKLNQGEVHVYLEHADKQEWACAECGAPSPLYDHQAERRWRHLDTVSTAQFCTPRLRAAGAANMGYGW